MNSSFEATQKEYPLFYPMSIALLGVLIGIIIGGFFFSEQVDAYAMNLFTEGISITLTVFVIDLLNRNQVENRDIQNCAFLMSSKDNTVAIQAVEMAKSRNWLESGVFKGKNFCEANLVGARLGFDNLAIGRTGKHILEKTNFSHANLCGAFFHHCNLNEANFHKSFLKKANFFAADLRGANLRATNLSFANLEDANLEGANLEGSTMPDSSLYTEETDLKRFTSRENKNFWRPLQEDVPYLIDKVELKDWEEGDNYRAYANSTQQIPSLAGC